MSTPETSSTDPYAKPLIFERGTASLRQSVQNPVAIEAAIRACECLDDLAHGEPIPAVHCGCVLCLAKEDLK